MRPVRALIGLADKYTTKRLEAACRHAMHFATSSHRSVKNILVHELDCHSSNPHSRRTDRSSSGSHASTATSTPTTPHRLPRSRGHQHGGWCIAPSRSSSRARVIAWTASCAAHRNCRSSRRTEAESARSTGVSRYHLARRRGLTSRPRAIFLPAPGRSVPRSSHTGPYRHSRPSVTLSCRPGRLSSAITGRCRVGHACGPAVVGSRAVSGSNQMAPNTRTRRSGLIQRSPRFAT